MKPSELTKKITLLASAQAWEAIVDWSSQLIAAGKVEETLLRRREVLFLYRSWIESLRELHHVEGLEWVAKHLLGMQSRSREIIALAAMALTYAGRRHYAAPLVRHLSRVAVGRSQLLVEAIATWHCESGNARNRAKGLQLFQVSNKKSGSNYFSLRNTLRYSVENESWEVTKSTLGLLVERFPATADADVTFAFIDFENKSYESAKSHLIKVLLKTPGQRDAALMYGQILLEQKKHLEAAIFVETLSPADFKGDVCYYLMRSRVSFEKFNITKNRQSLLKSFVWNNKACAILGALGIEDCAVSEFGRVIQDKIEHVYFEDKQQINQKSNKETENKIWIVTIDSLVKAQMRAGADFWLKCPEGVQEGDVIFASQRIVEEGDTGDQIFGIFRAKTAGISDSQFGHAALLSDGRKLSVENRVFFEAQKQRWTDSSGCLNFSDQGFAEFSTLSSGTLDRLIAEIEKSNKSIFNAEEYRNAG